MDFEPRSNAWKRHGVVFFEEELSLHDLLSLGMSDDERSLQPGVNTNSLSDYSDVDSIKSEKDYQKTKTSHSSLRASMRLVAYKLRRASNVICFGAF